MTTDIKRKLIADRFAKSPLCANPLTVKMGRFSNLGHCAENVRQALEEGSAKTVAEVIQVNPKGLIRYHYIEKLNDTEYIDNTLGYLSKEMKYYLIRELTLKELEGKSMYEEIRARQKEFLATLFTPLELETLDIQSNEL